MRPAIVVPAYSRVAALERLLASLARARYPGGGVHLVISLDGGAASGVATCARGFDFPAGSVEVVAHDRHLGLREHILWCGDQAERFDSVIVLEDDLVVDPWFYSYAQHALAAYAREEKVAGIALYAPQFNDYAQLPFAPLNNGTSAYFMQVPCSWGQAWTAGQWQAFRNWYAEAGQRDILADENLPARVRRWSEHSWKKYFVAYLATTGRCFSYPYQAYTTNCGDPGGTHVERGSDLHQVPLAAPDRSFTPPRMPVFDPAALPYDVFMEPRVEIDFDALGLARGSVCVDLYASKPLALLQAADYCLTTRPVESQLASFPLKFRPLAMNVYAGGARSGRGPIRLCRRDQLCAREPRWRRLIANYGLRWYFLSGPRSGLSLIVFGLYALIRRLLPDRPGDRR